MHFFDFRTCTWLFLEIMSIGFASQPHVFLGLNSGRNTLKTRSLLLWAKFRLCGRCFLEVYPLVFHMYSSIDNQSVLAITHDVVNLRYRPHSPRA